MDAPCNWRAFARCHRPRRCLARGARRQRRLCGGNTGRRNYAMRAAMNGRDMRQPSESRESMEQDQFLTILSREDALTRFEAALFPRAIPKQTRRLAEALGHALADDVLAPIDVPPFDRANVD